MLKLYTITAGMGETKDGTPIEPHHAKHYIDGINLHIAKVAGGYTMPSPTQGGWYNPETQTLVQEQGRQWQVLLDDERKATAIAAHIARVLQQHSVVLTKPDNTGEFIHG